MLCPFCGHDSTKVVDSRETNDSKAIRRRRECEKCEARFSTYEEIELMRLSVVKKNGEKEDYQRKKVESGLRRALQKRPVSTERIDKILGDIEYEIQSREVSEISSREIGRLVLEKLRNIDEVAYIRFASVYKSFGSIESFKKELEKIGG